MDAPAEVFLVVGILIQQKQLDHEPPARDSDDVLDRAGDGLERGLAIQYEQGSQSFAKPINVSFPDLHNEVSILC